MQPSETPNRYQSVVRDENRNTSHTQICELIARHCGANLRVLDVGCSSGYLGEHLRQRGHRVWGIEPSSQAAEAARAVLNGVFTGTLDAYLQEYPGPGNFDVAIFADVLEHIAEPAELLRRSARLLAQDGCIAVSVPNIAHGAIRGMLLEGRWAYQDLGILDRTHLRFYSRAGFIDLLDDASYAIVEMRRTMISTSEVNQAFNIGLTGGTVALVESTARDCDLHSFQFVALARTEPSRVVVCSTNNEWRAQRALAAFAHAVKPIDRPGRRVRQWLQGLGRFLGVLH
jgi:O-antigen biosynthesis protein